MYSVIPTSLSRSRVDSAGCALSPSFLSDKSELSAADACSMVATAPAKISEEPSSSSSSFARLAGGGHGSTGSGNVAINDDRRSELCGDKNRILKTFRAILAPRGRTCRSEPNRWKVIEQQTRPLVLAKLTQSKCTPDRCDSQISKWFSEHIIIILCSLRPRSLFMLFWAAEFDLNQSSAMPCPLTEIVACA